MDNGPQPSSPPHTSLRHFEREELESEESEDQPQIVSSSAQAFTAVKIEPVESSLAHPSPPPPSPPPPPSSEQQREPPEENQQQQQQLQEEPGPPPAQPPSRAEFDATCLLDVIDIKRKALEDMQGFEAARLRHFGTMFQSNILYWQSFKGLILRNQGSSAKTVAYVVAKMASYRATIAATYAIRDQVTGNKAGTNQANVLEDRKKQQKAASSARLVKRPSIRSTGSLGGRSSGSFSNFSMLDQSTKQRSVVEEMLEMEEKTARVMEDLCEELERDVLNVLEKTIFEIDSALSDITKKGDALLALLDQCEANSAQKFADYARAAPRSFLVSGGMMSGGMTAGASAPGWEAATVDTWLNDMNYRMAVSTQQVAWEGMSTQLSSFFADVKMLELQRRGMIRESLFTITQRQDEMWRSLPPLKDPVLIVLERINVDPRYIDTEIRAAMRSGAEALHLEAATPSSTSSAFPSSSSSSSTTDSISSSSANPSVNASDNNFVNSLRNLRSPLDSNLVQQLCCMERKRDGIIKWWAKCLVVLTYDDCLHVFDIPKDAKLKNWPRTSPQEAFYHLLPLQQAAAMIASFSESSGSSSSSSNCGGGGGGGGGGKSRGAAAAKSNFTTTAQIDLAKGANVTVTPTLTVNLRWCKIDYQGNIPSGGGNAASAASAGGSVSDGSGGGGTGRVVTECNEFELVEMLRTAGIMTAFTSFTTVRHTFRSADAQETAELVQKITAILDRERINGNG